MWDTKNKYMKYEWVSNDYNYIYFTDIYFKSYHFNVGSTYDSQLIKTCTFNDLNLIIETLKYIFLK